MKHNLSNGSGTSSPKPTHAQIAVAAFHLFLERGGEHGHDVADWLRAEELLKQQSAAGPVRLHQPEQQPSRPALTPRASRKPAAPKPVNQPINEAVAA